MDKKKVEVNKINAYIPLSTYIKQHTPKYVYRITDKCNTYDFIKQLSINEVLVKSFKGNHEILCIDDLYAFVEVVVFEDIRDYTYYQTEIEFKD